MPPPRTNSNFSPFTLRFGGTAAKHGPVITQLFSGQPVRLHPEGHLTFQRSAPEVRNRGSRVEIRARVTTRQEARKLLQGFKRRYPKLDVEEAMRGMVEEQNYLSEKVGAVCNFGGPQSGRSVVKSAFALAVASGVVPQTCNQARPYLKSEDGEPCFGYYYERDLVINRPIDRVFHCVAIKGDPVTGKLFGYVELFSVYRMIVGLSDQYCGIPLFNSYAIDPTSGEELDFDFDLSLTEDEVRTAISNQQDYTAELVLAFESAVAIAQSRSFAGEQMRVAKVAWTGAVAKLGLSPGQEMTAEIATALSREIVSRMQPFLAHLHFCAQTSDRGGAQNALTRWGVNHRICGRFGLPDRSPMAEII